MRLTPGQVVVRRYHRARDRLTIVQCCRVVTDDARGLRLWMPVGSPNRRLVLPDGWDRPRATPTC